MATYNKFNQFIEDVMHGVHDLANDSLVVALTAAANAPVATNEVLGDLTEIAYTNLSSRAVTVSTSAQTSGTYTLDVNDVVLTASGAVETFRYVVFYNDTPTSPADPLICWFDYGGNLTLASGETLTISINASGLFTAA